MNNAGMLPDIEPLAFKRAMGELNANCTYAVDDNYMYVMMSGYEKDLVKACQLLSKQILFPKLDDKQLQSLIGSAFGSRQMEKAVSGHWKVPSRRMYYTRIVQTTCNASPLVI